MEAVCPAKAITPKKSSTRHRWGKPERFPFKTERECSRCDMVKVTRHEAEIWTEFWEDGERVAVGKTPPCSGIRKDQP
jgi:hypothetical protein